MTTGNRTRRPTFPPSVWKVHDITVNNADRTNNFTEAWNRGFETLLSENHPSVGTCIELLQADAAHAASILLKHMEDDADGSRCNDGCTVSAWRLEYDNERRPLEYKLLSLTYKVLTTSQPSYLNNLISVQPPRSTRSRAVVTLSRPPTISSLKITDRSFRYASLRLWNQLPADSVSLAIHVSTHLLIHLSAQLYYHHHSHHPSLLHSFTPGSKPTFSTNPSHWHFRLLLPTGLLS